MTLEDFFTLTEMKDGLTAPSRVEELLPVMKEERDSVVKNVSDAIRQWTAVASTIAATDNKDCLDLFIQLDGLWFLNRWLKDAQEFFSDSSDNFVEETMTALLRALEKLHKNNERSISSDVMVTVKNLLDHHSSRVQDKARLLYGNWKVIDDVHGGIDSGEHLSDGISDGVTVTGEFLNPECSTKDGPVSGESVHEENGPDAARTKNLPSDSLDGVQPESTKDLRTETTDNDLDSHKNTYHVDMERRSSNHIASSFPSNPVKDNLSMKEDLPAKSLEETASLKASSLPYKEENIKVSDGQKLNESSDKKQKLDVTDPSGACVGSAQEATTEHNLQNDVETNKSIVLKSIALGEDKTPESEPKKESHLGMLRSSSENEFLYRKPGDLVTTISRMENAGTMNENKENFGVKDLRGGTKFIPSPDVIHKRISDIELEFGIVDALEVARKVAQEVEREVVDGREPSCNCSEKMSEDGIRRPCTPDSNGKQGLPAEDVSEEVPIGPNQSVEAYTKEEGQISNSDNPEKDLFEMESSQVTVAQELEPNAEKSQCDFDLNQEVCSDDIERVGNSFYTPVSVVSASRAAAAPGLPAAPLQFEGALGWKGSAATSAFRPASPRRNSDGDKTLSIGGTSSSSKQRLDCLDFDLNVTEAGDEKGAELVSGKQVTASSGLRSAESSQEVSTRKTDRLKLDLNRSGDDGDAPALDLRVEGQLFYNRNGHRSPSPSSSSSSMQPSLMNIDLNDRPYTHNDALEQGAYQVRSSRNVNAYGGPKTNDPVISIMGTRVEVNRKDLVPQVVSFPKGKALESATDASITRTLGFTGLTPNVSYTHSPAFGYNGLTLAPGMSFSSAIYGASGSIPYMVDSRTPVVPQIMGSASGLAIEGGNRDSLSLRQSFMSGQGRSIEEHLRANSQPSSSSGIGAKRKEPDGGWEPYPFNYIQQQFPWK